MLPVELRGGRERVLRHAEWDLYGAAVWDKGWVARRVWSWQRECVEPFISRGISTTATI